MLRQFTFTAVRGDEGGARTGPDGLLFLINDRTTALKLIGALAQGLQGEVNEDSPITVGLTGEMETESEDEAAAAATSTADRF